MSADTAGLVKLADQSQRRADRLAGEAEGWAPAAIVEAINGLTYSVLALVAVTTEATRQENGR